MLAGVALGPALWPATALGGDRHASDAWFRAGVERERAGDFTGALEAFDACSAEEPSASSVPAARARAKELRDRAEGRFAPLARLRDFLALPAPTAADALGLAADAEGFPDGRVRGEARLAAASALRHGASRDDLAEPLYRAAHADRSADRVTRALALSELVALHRGRGDPAGALALAREDASVAPALLRELARDVRRARVTTASELLVGAMLLVGALAFGWVVRRESPRGEGALDRAARAVGRPTAIGAAAWIGLGAALLARLHGAGDVRPFLFVALLGLPLVLSARAWHVAAEPSGPAYRGVRAVVAFAAAVALGFVALARSDARYLESLGW